VDFDRLDPEGYIRPEADLANVQPEYKGVPAAAADLLADEDRGRAERVERALTERFPVLFSAGVGLTHLQEVRSPAQRYGLQVFLRELAVCIRGEDLRPGLPRTKPSAAVAAGFHDETPAAFARARETLATSNDPETIRRVCRMTSRRMVQVAFAVVMAREGIWATVLEEQAAAVGASKVGRGDEPQADFRNRARVAAARVGEVEAATGSAQDEPASRAASSNRLR
jgi:hypothetical protein